MTNLAEIKARVEAATPGSLAGRLWYREDVPFLLAEIERLEARIRELERERNEAYEAIRKELFGAADIIQAAHDTHNVIKERWLCLRCHQEMRKKIERLVAVGNELAKRFSPLHQPRHLPYEPCGGCNALAAWTAEVGE